MKRWNPTWENAAAAFAAEMSKSPANTAADAANTS
jgi:hypothetical protein